MPDAVEIVKNVAETVKNVREIWDVFKSLKEKLSGISSWWSEKSDRSILIIGPGGVGKSTLAKMLSGNVEWLFNKPGVYTESLIDERYWISEIANPDIEIVVPPGQKHRRDWSWPKILSEVATGAYRGIILVLQRYLLLAISTSSVKLGRRLRGVVAWMLDRFDRWNPVWFPT